MYVVHLGHLFSVTHIHMHALSLFLHLFFSRYLNLDLESMKLIRTGDAQTKMKLEALKHDLEVKSKSSPSSVLINQFYKRDNIFVYLSYNIFVYLSTYLDISIDIIDIKRFQLTRKSLCIQLYNFMSHIPDETWTWVEGCHRKPSSSTSAAACQGKKFLEIDQDLYFTIFVSSISK